MAHYTALVHLLDLVTHDLPLSVAQQGGRVLLTEPEVLTRPQVGRVHAAGLPRSPGRRVVQVNPPSVVIAVGDLVDKDNSDDIIRSK